MAEPWRCHGACPVRRRKVARAIATRDHSAFSAMVDARDVAAVAAAVLTGNRHEGNIHTITGPGVLTFQDVAKELSEGLSQRVEFITLSPEASEEELREADMAVPVPPFVDYCRELSSEDTALDIKTAAVEEVTGHMPRSLVQFAADHAEAFGSGREA